MVRRRRSRRRTIDEEEVHSSNDAAAAAAGGNARPSRDADGTRRSARTRPEQVPVAEPALLPQQRRSGQRRSQRGGAAAEEEEAGHEDTSNNNDDDDDADMNPPGDNDEDSVAAIQLPDIPMRLSSSDATRYERENRAHLERQKAEAERVLRQFRETAAAHSRGNEEAQGTIAGSQGSGSQAAAVAQVSQGSSDPESSGGRNGRGRAAGADAGSTTGGSTAVESSTDADSEAAVMHPDAVASMNTDAAVRVAREMVQVGPDLYICATCRCKNPALEGSIMCATHQTEVPSVVSQRDFDDGGDEDASVNGDEKDPHDSAIASHGASQNSRGTSKSSRKASRASRGASQNSLVSWQKRGGSGRSSKASSSVFLGGSKRSIAGSGLLPLSRGSGSTSYEYRSYTEGGTKPSIFADCMSDIGSRSRMPPPSQRGQAEDEKSNGMDLPKEVSPESLKRKHDDLDEDDGLDEDDMEINVDGPEDQMAPKKPRILRMEEGGPNPEDESASEMHDDGEEQQDDIPPPQKPLEAGIITRINVKNFMSHRNMTVDLCPNVNFIHGQNGSGKSALLVALQVALGARAQQTQRGTNTEEYIRRVDDNDTNVIRQAVVRVTMKNAGVDAFKPGVYGDEITIERIIKRGHPNELKLRDNRGRVVSMQSNARADLVELLDKWNIHVENPVTALTQENAKFFLQGTNKQKYDFFENATDLRRLSRLYEKSQECLELLQLEASRLADSFEEDREAVVKAKSEYDQYKKVSELERNKAQLEEMLAWVEYRTHLETKVEKERQAVEAVLAKVKSKETELEALEEAALESAADETSLRERLAALAAEKKQSEDESRHTIKVKKEEKSQLKELRNELNRTRREMTEIQEIVREAEMALEEKRSEIAHRHENAQVQDQERTLQLASEERRLQEAEQELENVEANIERLQMAQGTKETDVDDAKNEMKQAQVLVERCTTPVKSLQASSANSVAVFGHNCALVKRSVDEYIEEGRFRDNVIGPIGVHCMIYQGKERFGSLAEAAVGPGVLDGFIVFNDHDRKIVQQIRAHHNVRHTCGVFQMHHHEKYHVPNPPEGVETVASVLRVMDDDVFNCLVDFCRIEDKALCNSKTESENRLLQQQPNGGFKIAVSRIKEVLFLPNGDRWKVTGGCHLSLMSNTKELRPARLGMDTREALRDAEERMEDANASFRQKQHDFESLRAQLQSIEAELEEIKSRRRHLQNRVHNAHIRIGSLQRRRNEAMIEQDHDTSEEEAAVEHAKESWSLKDARCTSIHRRYDETMMAITEKSRDVEEEENRTKQLSQDIADTEKDMEKYVQRSDEIKFRREILADARSELQKQQDVLLDEERKGEVLCLRAKILVANHREAEARRRRRENGTSCSSEDVERVSPNDIAMPDLNGLESMSYYASRIATNQKAIKEALEEIGRGGSEGIESAYEKYLRAKNLFDTKVAKNEELKRLCKVMKEDVKNRKSRWLQFRAFISDIVSIRFGEILTLRDSFGSVLFDHDSKTLMPTFVPDSRNEINIQRDMMGLSGGERSLSTIALLLALGETAENPFRAMDEFDVFLDAVTRKIITDNLIKIGKRMSNRQFIFLTPQDISDVEADQMVKILSLSNPNRSHQGAVGAAPN